MHLRYNPENITIFVSPMYIRTLLSRGANQMRTLVYPSFILRCHLSEQGLFPAFPLCRFLCLFLLPLHFSPPVLLLLLLLRTQAVVLGRPHHLDDVAHDLCEFRVVSFHLCKQRETRMGYLLNVFGATARKSAVVLLCSKFITFIQQFFIFFSFAFTI